MKPRCMVSRATCDSDEVFFSKVLYCSWMDVLNGKKKLIDKVEGGGDDGDDDDRKPSASDGA